MRRRFDSAPRHHVEKKQQVEQQTCALCREQRPLRKSHIIPEFFYSTLYDPETHRYFQISTEPGIRTIERPKGLYEKLLCDECEERLSPLESYVRPILKGGVEIKIEDRADRVVVHDLDYSKIKLFALSLLWRAGVSKRPEFEAVVLGRHEAKLRQMLLDSEPGSTLQYPVSIISPPPATGIIGEANMAPDSLRLFGHPCYRFMLDGIFWLFVVSSHFRDLRDKYWSIDEDGTLTYYKGNKSTVRFLTRFFEELATSGNLPNRKAP